MEKLIRPPLEIEIALFKLKDEGIHKIEFEFQGSGDDGAIDDITYYNKNGEDAYLENIDQDTLDKIQELLEEKVYTILDHVSDWYNNEGGYGKVSIYTDTGRYDLDNNIRIIDYQHESFKGKTSTFVNWDSHEKINNGTS